MLHIGWLAGCASRSTAGSAYDAVAKTGNVITAGSYVDPTVKTFITAGCWTRRGPSGYEPAVMLTTAGCLITVCESPCDD